ncbi:T3SS effector HopA1 family protein [Microtetraspora sp. NBRC 13810]|uniref:T3SS effector HopA1 family protein n=1 Tax=Microtetraspora sp. NBRC 13810 TaxID=3030990 RepID=UPI0025539E9E|nr:T3SS effector HopA1 family protein [Microtetraspora sp. NBRC 13810]
MGTLNEVALTAEVAAVLKAVHISSDGLRAQVGDQVVEADGSRALWPALSSRLYEYFHIGHAHDPTLRPGTRDLPLEAALAEGVPHRYTTSLVQVYETGETDWIVDLLDVRVRVPVDRVVSMDADGRAEVRADAVRPALSPGFFLCDGSAGSVLGGGPILRLYLHLADSSYTPGAWRTALGVLEGRKVPYRAKAFSRPSGYPRRDALVIYLEEKGWPVLESLVGELSALPGLVDGVSAFARRVGPGLAVAWDPADNRTGMRMLSFGEHRCRVIAEGLIMSAAEGVPAEAAVVTTMLRGGVDPTAPYRNVTSPALPIDG